MKIIFFDSEFDNFSDLGLISIGFISECEQLSFYKENSELKLNRCSEFVHKTVLPLLNLNEHGVKYNEMKSLFEKWVNSIEDNEIVFVADYSGDLKIYWELIKDLKFNKKVRSQLMFDYLPQVAKERLVYNYKIMDKVSEHIMNSISNELSKCPQMQHHALFDAHCNCKGWKAGFKFLYEKC